MNIKRTPKGITIQLSPDVDIEGVQDLVDYLEYQEATSGSVASQEDVDNLVKEVKKGWWERNKKSIQVR